jgi:hypothetical protein
MRKLWPPLSDIEHLLGAPEAAAAEHQGEAVLCEPADDAPPPPMPDFLRDAVRRRVAAARASTLALPAPGLVLRLGALPGGSRTWPFASQLALLIDKQDTDGRWSGWLAAGEADYAGEDDVLLEPGDEPFEPSAGVIQLWNPLTLRIADPMPVLARLSPQRLEAIRQHARRPRLPGRSGEPAPGRMRRAETPAGDLLVGSPIGSGSGNDPRLAYGHLYRNAATILAAHWQSAVEALPRSVSAEAKAPAGGLFARLLRSRIGLVAASVLTTAGTMLPFVLVEQAAVVRSAGGPQRQLPEIEVSFKPGASEADVRALVLSVRGELAGSPGQLGIYRIALPEGNVSEALALAKNSLVVDAASSKEVLK